MKHFGQRADFVNCCRVHVNLLLVVSVPTWNEIHPAGLSHTAECASLGLVPKSILLLGVIFLIYVH